VRRRVGVFGGTFDPIHLGHLHLAETVAQMGALDSVLFLPMASPAHRETHAGAGARRAMTELAIAGNPKFAFDSTGLEQAAPAYTFETMRLLRERRPDDEFSFIAGIDALVRNPWRRLDDVARTLERFFVAARQGVDPAELTTALADLAPDLRSKFTLVDVSLVDVSSTSIRTLVSERRSIRYLVPDAVRDYIAQHSLYA
jgi:nicotinate-nucleotide adenylyltransferase